MNHNLLLEEHPIAEHARDVHADVKTLHPSEISPFESLANLLVGHPERAKIFEKWQLPYENEAAHHSLVESCARRGISYFHVLVELRHPDAELTLASGCTLGLADLTKFSGHALAQHIRDIHHPFLQCELPRLLCLISMVSVERGGEFPDLLELDGLVDELMTHLDYQMTWDDRELLTRFLGTDTEPPAAETPGVPSAWSFPPGEYISTDYLAGKSAPKHAEPAVLDYHESELLSEVLADNHRELHRCMKLIHDLTRGYSPPEHTSLKYRDLLRGLRSLEADLNQYFAEEEQVLLRLTTG